MSLSGGGGWAGFRLPNPPLLLPPPPSSPPLLHPPPLPSPRKAGPLPYFTSHLPPIPCLKDLAESREEQVSCRASSSASALPLPPLRLTPLAPNPLCRLALPSGPG